VQIDDVRIFDMAFDESQRVQLSKQLALLEGRLAADDIGGCLVELDSHWPRFLGEFVADDAARMAARPAAVDPAAPRGPGQPREEERSGGMLDRMRRWWQ